MMTTSHFERDDPAWHRAWAWVMREHEQPLEGVERQTLKAWLAESDVNRRAYEQASSLWLLAGLVPPTQIDLPDPSDEDLDRAKD